MNMAVLARRACALLAATLIALPAIAWAELSEIKVAKQYGISYLPLMLMEDGKLIEKHAKAAGVDVTVTWATFAGGNVMNDALLSDSLQFASGGVGPLIILWSRTRANLDVRAVGSLNSMPLYLVSRNPNVKTIKDLSDKDRIGMPAVKISVQALALQMAAEQAFDRGSRTGLTLLPFPWRTRTRCRRCSRDNPRSMHILARRRSSIRSSPSPACTWCSTTTT